VFVCTAPLVGQPNAGLTGQGLRLACAEPGDQLAIFGEALRELTERATYLYEETGRYWFSTQPTLNRLADDRAKAFADHDVDSEIVKVLTDDAKIRGGFHRVFAAPDDPCSIEEAEAVSLVILSPSMPHSGKGALKSAATDSALDALMRCRASQRRFRNTLLFVAPDEAQLTNAREVMRKALAWKSIVEDDRLQLQLTQGQATDAHDKAKSHRESAHKAVRGAWSHIFYPIKSDAAGTPFNLEHNFISTRERPAVPAMVYDKAKADGIILEKLGSERLWHALKPIWLEDTAHLSITEIAEWFAAYVYLPRLRDRVVLEIAIREAVAKLDPQFGYADCFDEVSGEYRNPILAKTAPEVFSSTALLVRADEVQQQFQNRPPIGALDQTSSQEAATERLSPNEAGKLTAAQRPNRFYGSVEIDMVRPVKSFDTILSAVVMELQRTQGTKVTLTLEIEATATGGFAEGDVGIVRDNAKQLKFKADSTGFGEYTVFD
jgi:hypothetical protein